MERDFPVGHPAASDYKGEPYTPPSAPFGEDFPRGHPARGGANVGTLDSPDGMRAAANARAQDLQELAAVGSLPPLRDDKTGELVTLTPQELAHVYAVRQGLRPALAQEITDAYKLTPATAAASEPPATAISAEDQAIAYIVSRGYTPERAREILRKYGVPDVLADKEKDAHR